MANATKGLIALSGLAFLLAVITVLSGRPILGLAAEGLSRACSNLALIAIGLKVTCSCERPRE